MGIAGAGRFSILRSLAETLRRGRPTFFVATIVCLIFVFGLRLFDSARRNTLTVDEPHYIGVGLYLWQSGDYDYRETLHFHPPLAFHLASLPLLAVDLGGIPITRDVGTRLRNRTDWPPDRIRWLSRLPFILLSCWGALLAALFAGEAVGWGAALLAVFLYTTSPLMLAYAAIAHSDITVTVFTLQLIYTFWRWLRKSSWTRLIVCGSSLGLALLSKMNALVLLPPIGLVLLLDAYGLLQNGWRGAAQGFRPALRALRLFFALLTSACVVIWLGYGGSFALAPIESGPFAGIEMPWFINGMLADLAANGQARSIFFHGQIAEGGRFWYLIPVAWAFKTPIPVLILLLVSLVLVVSRRGGNRIELASVLLLPITCYLAVVTLFLRVPLGVRYALPLIPLLHVFLATTLAPLWSRRRLAIASCLIWLAAEGAFIHPHYLAYFNALAGGPARAHQWLIESNLDWGQDLASLADALAKRGNPSTWLAYFGPERPERYGIRARPLRGCHPVRGWVAISATYLHGLYSPGNPFIDSPPGCYDWLLQREPVAQPGYSIFLYHVEPGATDSDG